MKTPTTPPAAESAHVKLVATADDVRVAGLCYDVARECENRIDQGLAQFVQMTSVEIRNERRKAEAFIASLIHQHPAHAAAQQRIVDLEKALDKADALELYANSLACARDRDERNSRCVKLATAQYEYKQARLALRHHERT